MKATRLAAFTSTSIALALATSVFAQQKATQSDVADRFDASTPTATPTTAPAAQQPALPPGHPPLPGGPQLPAGHPPLPNTMGPVDPNKAAGQPLPAGHPQVNATTNPAGTGLKMNPQSGTLDIRVVQSTAGAPAITNGTPLLELYDGEKLFASMPTPLEEDGHIHVFDIPISKPFVPVVKVNYADVEYEVAGEPFDAQHLSQEIVVKVYETSTTPPDWLIRMRHVMLQPTESHIEVSEVFVIENPTDHVFTKAKDAQGKSQTVFSLPLPPGAHDVHIMSGFGAAEMTIEEGQIVNRTGMVPGQSQYQIAYALPVRDGSVHLPLASPAIQKNVAVLVPDDGTTVDAAGLTAAGTTDMGPGNKVRLFKAADIPAGTDLKVNVSGFEAVQPPAADKATDPAAHLTEQPSTQPATAVAKPSAQRFAIVGLVGVVVAGTAFVLTRRPSKPEDANAQPKVVR